MHLFSEVPVLVIFQAASDYFYYIASNSYFTHEIFYFLYFHLTHLFLVSFLEFCIKYLVVSHDTNYSSTQVKFSLFF